MEEEKQAPPSQVLVTFYGFGSALFEIQYQNVSPHQLYSLARRLVKFADTLIDQEERKKDEGQIQVPKSEILMP